nr:Hpt domain-containing protein [Bacteroidia bacterium]
NMAYLNEMSSGDIEFVVSMLIDWSAKLPEYLAELNLAMDNRNKGEIRFLAHKLYSTFHIIGALDLVGICADIEELARVDGDIDELQNYVSKITPFYNKVLIEVNKELKQLSN